MNLSQIETELAALRNKHSQAAGQLALLQSQKTTKAAELSSAQIDITTWTQVQTLFGKVSEFARKQLVTKIEQTVSAAMEAVFGEGMRFEVLIGTKGNQPTAEWQVVSTYGAYTVQTDPQDANGGGVVDVISLALRLSLLELARPKPEGPLILDEPGKMISTQFAPAVAHFLKRYAETTGRQIIMVTHNGELAEVADVTVRVEKRNGESFVVQAGSIEPVTHNKKGVSGNG